MTGHVSERTRWAVVMAFAIAMAWVEAASVSYIRALVDRIEPYQADPLLMASPALHQVAGPARYFFGT